MAQLTKEEIGFTQVKNEVLVDPEISFFDKGVFAYLFSKPEGWDFSADRIKEESSDGRDAILSSLKRLENRGYLVRKKKPNGRVTYLLKYSLALKTQLRVEEPNPENATKGISHSGETRPISNTLSISNTLAVKTQIVLPEWLNVEAWEAWVVYKKERKQKLTPRTIEMQLKKLGADIPNHVAMIEQSISNGWTGLFTIKSSFNNSKPVYVAK